MRRARLFLLYCTATWVAGCAAFLTAQQSFDPREVSFRSAVYFPRSQLTFRADVSLVDVLVVVKDGRGQTVAGLQQRDFEIRDSGRRREIAAFSVLTAARPAPAEASPAPSAAAVAPTAGSDIRPRFLGIVFDDLNTEFPEFRRSQLAARRFVKEGLSAGDRVAIFSTYGQQLLPFTSDADLLMAAIDKMSFRAQKLFGGICPVMSAYESYLVAHSLDSGLLEVKIAEALRCEGRDSSSSSSLGSTGALTYGGAGPPDARGRRVFAQAQANWAEVRARSLKTLGAVQGIVDFMASMPGTRMLLVTSGGFLSGTLTLEQDALVRRALSAGVVINSLDAKGLYTLDLEMPPGGNVASVIVKNRIMPQEMLASNEVLAVMADGTGGRFFSNSNDLAQGFRQLGARPEVSYLLGFRPDPQPDGQYHKLQVRLSGANRYSLQARPGYVAVKEEASEPIVERRIDRELFGAGSSTEVPASITTAVHRPAGGVAALMAAVHLDINRLGFLDRAGVRSARINLLVALIDQQGNFVTGKEGTIDLALRESTFARLSAKGMALDFQLEPPPGRYRLRGLIEEADSGKLTAIEQVVEIP
jgi:VWFA-related protein